MNTFDREPITELFGFGKEKTTVITVKKLAAALSGYGWSGAGDVIDDTKVVNAVKDVIHQSGCTIAEEKPGRYGDIILRTFTVTGKSAAINHLSSGLERFYKNGEKCLLRGVRDTRYTNSNLVDAMQRLVSFRIKESLGEAFSVKLGRNEQPKNFDSLEKAVEFINNGINDSNSFASSYILYDENGKELIWLDRFDNLDDRGGWASYNASKHEGKDVVDYSQEKGLTIVKSPAAGEEDDEVVRSTIIQQMVQQKFLNQVAIIKKYKFIEDSSKPSYIDYDNKVVHYNPDESGVDVAKKFGEEMKTKGIKEAVETEEPLADKEPADTSLYRDLIQAISDEVDDEDAWDRIINKVGLVIEEHNGEEIRELNIDNWYDELGKLYDEDEPED